MAGGEQFVDILGMATRGVKGPKNVIRIAADQNGILWASVLGAPYVLFSSIAGSFGANTQVNLLDSNSASVEAWRQLIEFRVNTAGAVESRQRVYLELASVETEVGGWEFQGASFPMVYVGAQSNITGMRAIGASNADLMVGNSAAFSISTTAVTSQNAHTFNNDANYRGLAGTMSTNTYQRTIGNKQNVPGTPTINGITTGTAADGYELLLKVASGTTLVHNSGAPGSGAVKLINRAAANIVTTAARVIPYCYDSTDACWYEMGSGVNGIT